MGNPTIFGPQSPYSSAPAGSPPKSPFLPPSSLAFTSSAPPRRRRASLHVHWADGWEDPDRRPAQRDQIDSRPEQHYLEQDGGHHPVRERRPSWPGATRPVIPGAPPSTVPINILRLDSVYGPSPGQRSHMPYTYFEEMASNRHPSPSELPITQRRSSFQDNIVPPAAAMQHLPHAVPSESVVDLETPCLPDEPEVPCQEQQPPPQRRPSWSGVRPVIMRPSAHPENLLCSPGQRSHIPRTNFEDIAPEVPPRPRRPSFQGNPILPPAPSIPQASLEPDESPFLDETDRDCQDMRPGWPSIARPAMIAPHVSHPYSETYFGSLPGQRSFNEGTIHPPAAQTPSAPPRLPFHSEKPLNLQPILRHPRHPFDSNSLPKPLWVLNPYNAPSTPSLLHERLGPVLHPLLDAEHLNTCFYFSLSSPYFTPPRLRSLADSSYATRLKSDLTLPATSPGISRVRIMHEGLSQWPVRISNSHGGAITVNDVLRGVRHWLHAPVTHKEWARLAKDEGGQMRVARAFSKRWKASPDAMEKARGVKRIDYLWLWAKHGKRDITFKGFIQESAGTRGEIWRLIVA
jgi:hypothetical protein